MSVYIAYMKEIFKKLKKDITYRIVYQLEVYDEIWRDRLSLEEGKHSEYAIKLAKKIIDKLEDIPDHCAECFPFETIENLTDEYLSDD